MPRRAATEEDANLQKRVLSGFKDEARETLKLCETMK
jgi:hypothetical protein